MDQDSDRVLPLPGGKNQPLATSRRAGRMCDSCRTPCRHGRLWGGALVARRSFLGRHAPGGDGAKTEGESGLRL